MISHEDLNLFAEAIMLFDRETHPSKASKIIATQWDSAAERNQAGFAYVFNKQSMKPVPPRHLPRHLIPPKDDFFLIFPLRIERYLQQRQRELPGVPVATHSLQFAAHAVWEKTQWKHERAKPPHVNPEQLQVSTSDILDCTQGKARVTFADTDRQRSELELSMWRDHSASFIQSFGNQEFGYWRCCRNVEAMTVAFVAVSHQYPADMPPFMRRLKELVDSRLQV